MHLTGLLFFTFTVYRVKFMIENDTEHDFINIVGGFYEMQL